MTIGAFLHYIDEVKPHAFSDATIVGWLNDIEGVVETDALLFPEVHWPYVVATTRVGPGAIFPDDGTLVLPDAVAVCPGGTVTLSGSTSYSQNDGSYRLLDVDDGGKVLRFAPGSFGATGETPESGESARLDFDGSGVELLLSGPHQRLYGAYIIAMIDFANGEYGKYQNDMVLFNAFWECFTRWYAQNRRPADVQFDGGDTRRLYDERTH